MNVSIKHTLKQLRLSGMADNLDLRLQEAAGHQLTHQDFLEALMQDEVNLRQQRAIHRRTKAARFREQRSLQNFDFSFNNINREQIYQLATGRFIDEKQDLLLIGPPELQTYYFTLLMLSVTKGNSNTFIGACGS